MANRRMMSRRVLESARFLRLPTAARELYFQMLLRADDDGVVEAWTLLQLTRTDETALNHLAAQEFVVILNSDLVCFIRDWAEHNSIRSDRKVDSIYRALVEERVPDAVLLPKRKEPADADNAPSDGGQSADIPQQRIGKDRVGEESAGEERKEQVSSGEESVNTAAEADAAEAAAPTRLKKYGKYGNVLLTPAEFAEFREEFPQKWANSVERLDFYIETKGAKYQNHLAVLRQWAAEDAEKPHKSGGTTVCAGSGVDPIALAAIQRRMAARDAGP